MADIEKILLAGLQASYDALTPDDGKLYFCTDTRNMYKGSNLYTDGIRVVTTDPTSPAIGKLYYNSTEDTLKVYENGAWVVVRLAYTTSVTSASTDSQVATAKAVYDYVTAAIEDVTGSGAVVQSVVAGTDAGTLNVTTGGAASTVTIPGVTTSVTYDSTTRTFTFANTDGSTVTAALGIDIFVQSGEYDTASGNIVLTLNDGSTIEVPASALVDEYTGGSTTTATVSVSSGNEITAAVVLSSDSNNAITIDATNGGLLVDLSDYCTTSAMESAVQAVADDLDTLESQVTANTSAITLLNGDSSTSGSVAYAVAQLNTTLSADIATAQAAAEAAQDTADANTTSISDLTTRVATLEDNWGFGTF